MVTSRDEQDRGGTGRHAAGQARQVSCTRPRKGGTSLDLQVGMRGCQEESHTGGGDGAPSATQGQCHPRTRTEWAGSELGASLPQTHSRSPKGPASFPDMRFQ